MGDKARHHTDERHIRVNGKAEALLQLCLVDGFALQVLCVIRLIQVLVRRRVIAHHVNAVQNAGKLPGTLAQNRVQLVGEPRIKNFLRVRRAHGRDPVRALDRALHQVHAIVVFE